MEKKPLNIVLAEDDESDRMDFIEALGESKIVTLVTTVNDGVELMNYLLKEDNVTPDLLFLDLNMPRKNGLECLKEIRSIEKFKEIVIAIYSTSSYEKDVERTFNGGANIYLKKPNDFEMLKKALHQIVLYVDLYREPPLSLANFMFRI